MDMSLHCLWEMVKDREASHAAIHGNAKGRDFLWVALNFSRKCNMELQDLGSVLMLCD